MVAYLMQRRNRTTMLMSLGGCLLLPAAGCLFEATDPTRRNVPSPHSKADVQDTNHVRWSGQCMGTEWQVTVGQRDATRADRSLHMRLKQRLSEMESTLSHFDPESSLSRFNRSREGCVVPKSIAALVQRAMIIHDATEGAFDITVAPLVDLWGFGVDGPISSPPSDDAIRRALSMVGMSRLTVVERPDGRLYLRKTDSRLRIDLSAIAKGYAVDQLAAILDDAGIENYLVGLGGEYRAQGERVPGKPWRIGLETPRSSPDRSIYRVLERTGGAVATSGTYRQRRRASPPAGSGTASHIIDPRTGRPVAHTTVAVTVLADSCEEADAWATALLVLGRAQGVRLAMRQQITAIFVYEEDGELRCEICRD